jgi:hypothetical protein
MAKIKKKKNKMIIVFIRYGIAEKRVVRRT